MRKLGLVRGWQIFPIVFGVVSVAAGFMWFELCYSAQVNASISAVNLSARILEAKKESLEPPLALDRWGRPFGRFEGKDCLVLVSYGSDGVPDRDDYGTSLCATIPKARSSCWWPTLDTVVVNGAPTSSCMK